MVPVFSVFLKKFEKILYFVFRLETSLMFINFDEII